MTPKQIAAQRLYNQQLEQPRLSAPAEAAAWLGALQAQDYAGAKWSIGLRLPGATEAAVERAIADKKIVRTWLMRGTLHFAAAQDLRWLLGLLAPGIVAGNARRYGELGLDERTLARSNLILAEALQGGRELDRKQLLSLLERKGLSTKGQRAPYLLQRASLEGLLCHGVTRANNPTYFFIDDCLPKAQPMDPAEAAAELARRYFTSRGPAALEDFRWWSGLKAAEARAGLEAIKSELDEVKVAGPSYWRSQDQPAVKRGGPSVKLLPGFDEYLLGYQDRAASIAAEHLKSWTPGGGTFNLAILVNGRMAGTWKRTVKKDKVVLAFNCLTTLTPAEARALRAAAAGYGEYMNLAVEVQ